MMNKNPRSTSRVVTIKDGGQEYRLVYLARANWWISPQTYSQITNSCKDDIHEHLRKMYFEDDFNYEEAKKCVHLAG